MRKAILLIIFNFILVSWASGQNLKPYILAGTVQGKTVSETADEVTNKLKSAGFDILGTYNPENKKEKKLIAVSHPELKTAVAKTGGFAGFALALRVAITSDGENVEVSYTNPVYWGSAYFGENYDKVAGNYTVIDRDFKTALSAHGVSEGFGSKKGLSQKKIKKYQYMMGMPYFEDNVVIGKFSNYSEAVKTIDQNFQKGITNLLKVYEISLPSKEIKLYGVGLKGENGENAFMPVIDQATPKHTAFLPYELLVYKDKAYMLHGRYRIALSFPDLTMGTFMKIVSTPGNIEDLLSKACK